MTISLTILLLKTEYSGMNISIPWLMMLLVSLSHQQPRHHYNDVLMDVMASQITSLTIVYSTLIQADQRKHQSSASLAFVRRIHRWPVTGEFPAQKASNTVCFPKQIRHDRRWPNTFSSDYINRFLVWHGSLYVGLLDFRSIEYLQWRHISVVSSQIAGISTACSG